MFGSVLVLFEEVLIAIRLFKVQKAIIKTPNLFYLEAEAVEEYVTYFNGVATHNCRRLSIMAREASIQLVYMITLIIYGYFNQPVLELDYQGWKYPTAIWIGLLIWMLISTCLSAYSTFPPLLKNQTLTSYRRYKRSASLLEQMVKIIQILLHLFFASILLFLLRSPIHPDQTSRLTDMFLGLVRKPKNKRVL